MVVLSSSGMLDLGEERARQEGGLQNSSVVMCCGRPVLLAVAAALQSVFPDT